MKVDFLIVGQGVSGTFLSFYLLKAGKAVLVIDDDKPNAASRVASGVVNPVTGRRIVKTWKIDELMPFVFAAYNDISNFLQMPSCISRCSILNIHATKQMQVAFEQRLRHGPNEYLRTCANENDWKQYFNFEYGIGETHPAFVVNLFDLLALWREYLIGVTSLLNEHFNEADCLVQENQVVYKDIVAQRIIYCNGTSIANSSYFEKLPSAYNKGEAAIISVPGLPRNFIYKQGLSIVPWKNNDLFWVGSTYEWNFLDDLPSEGFKEKVETYLKANLKLPYSVVEYLAGIRPANTERRPFVGFHPTYKNVGVLNGMGTKGCSLSPYFANQLAQNILTGESVDAQVDISRFSGEWFS
ncbi:NAD(P)/FAD-dependent oxidoreductase [Arachidicoccus sp.]|uniref:NAD(P)/FAD-dependent oxidoreductase n=1 Tax=Arachidicoccus sp. TaxID=1872624 RepID=UPI003D20CCF3